MALSAASLLLCRRCKSAPRSETDVAWVWNWLRGTVPSSSFLLSSCTAWLCVYLTSSTFFFFFLLLRPRWCVCSLVRPKSHKKRKKDSRFISLGQWVSCFFANVPPKYNLASIVIMFTAPPNSQWRIAWTCNTAITGNESLMPRRVMFYQQYNMYFIIYYEDRMISALLELFGIYMCVS